MEMKKAKKSKAGTGGKSSRDVNKDNPTQTRMPNRIEMLVLESCKFLANRNIAAAFGYASLMKLTAQDGQKFYLSRSNIYKIYDYKVADQITGSIIVSKSGDESIVREKMEDIVILMGYDGSEIKSKEDQMQEPTRAE